MRDCPDPLNSFFHRPCPSIIKPIPGYRKVSIRSTNACSVWIIIYIYIYIWSVVFIELYVRPTSVRHVRMRPSLTRTSLYYNITHYHCRHKTNDVSHSLRSVGISRVSDTMRIIIGSSSKMFQKRLFNIMYVRVL